MKYLLSLAFLFLVTTQKSISQNTNTDLTPKWIELKIALKSRALKVFSLTNELLKIGSVDKKLLLNKSNLLSKEMIVFIDSSKSLDTSVVISMFTKNENLTKSVMKILVSMEALLDNKNEKVLTIFFADMDIAEKAINKAKRNYNGACKDNRREDLLFVNPNPDKDIKVEF